jgi:hypothetical protein
MKKVEELEAQIKYLKDKMEVCAYGKREIEELVSLQNELDKLLESEEN